MSEPDPNVKPECRPFRARVLDFIECHPRLGWYFAAWMTLLTINALWDVLDGLLALLH